MARKQVAVEEMVEEWLRNNGYSGLCTDGCGCSIEVGLFPCQGEGSTLCVAGYAGASGYVYETLKQAKRDDGPDDVGVESFV